MNYYLRLSILLATIWAMLAALLAFSFGQPALIFGLAAWVLAFLLAWLTFGLCSVAGGDQQ